MLSIKRIIANLLSLHQDAYIERTYSIGTASSWYHNGTINIAVDGYTPISVTASSNQASAHFYNLSFTKTTLSVGRAQWNASTTLSSNTATFVVRYIKTSLLGGSASN